MAHVNRFVSPGGIFLQDVCASISQNPDLCSIRSYDQFNPSNIDALIAFEMTQLKANHAREEQKYVEQMLIDNPVVVERRKPNNVTTTTTTGGSSSDTNSQHTSSSSVQLQRSDSCRRSRINNKIKKSNMRFRHKFVAEKLKASSQMLECIHDVIEQAERQLISRGHNEATLLRLKTQMTVQKYSPERSLSTDPQQRK